MAAPDLLALTAVNIKTAIGQAGTSAADLIAAVPTGEAYNVEAIFASNKHASTAGFITVILKRSGTDYYLCPGLRVSTKTILNVLQGKPVYMEEGDSLRILADAASVFDVFAVYTRCA